MSKHPIVHVEISAQDLEAAGKFYADVFGWKVQQMPEMSYAMFETDEGELGGGLNPVTDENPAGSVVVYIDADDINATLSQVEKSGGKSLVPKTLIPGMGWFAIFVDPTGNKIGLYTTDPQAA